ncbi:MAG: nuclear transport factor 2 family protein [Gemmatimonadaceae bacterium]
MRASLGLCLLVALASPVVAQPNAALKAADKARTAALDDGNAKVWGKYTTEDFLVIGADGSVKTKQQRFAEIDGHPRTQKATASDERWRVYGGAAVHTSLSEIAGGKPTRNTAVWVKDHGTWKTASVQLTTVGETPPAK